MKRYKAWILAGVLGVAVIAAVTSLSTPLWEKLAYERKELGNGMWYLQARAHWLPGRQTLLPNQPCESCVQDSHGHCFAPYLTGSKGGPGEQYVVLNVSRGFIALSKQTSSNHEVYDDFQCTCTHPSHQDSP